MFYTFFFKYKLRIIRYFDGNDKTTTKKVHFYSRFSSDAWRRRRRRRRSGLQMDDSDINPADLKKDMFPDELPEGAPSSLSAEPLEDGDEEYDVHPKHAPV